MSYTWQYNLWDRKNEGINRMKLTLLPCLFLAVGLAACAHVQPAATAVAPTSAATYDMGVAHGRTAEVDVQAASRTLQGYDEPTSHHWTADDITEYDVTLTQRTGPGLFAPVGDGVTVVLPTGGESPKTKAVFLNLQQGQYYRASVKAMGRIGGLQGTGEPGCLNAQAGDADAVDFDFTAAQDVVSAMQETVTIHFDGVSFNGKGLVTFASPDDGAYVNPSATPVAVGWPQP